MSITITGRVIPGRRQGRRMGFPTINIEVPKSIPAKQSGVYFSLTRIGEHRYAGLTHLGFPKTFGLTQRTCETHLLKFPSRELEGEDVVVRLLHKIRDVERFPALSALKRQIRKDVRAAKRFFDV